jgi:hypothetical protein
MYDMVITYLMLSYVMSCLKFCSMAFMKLFSQSIPDLFNFMKFKRSPTNSTGTFVLVVPSQGKPSHLKQIILGLINSSRLAEDHRTFRVWKRLSVEKTLRTTRNSFSLPSSAPTYHRKYYYFSFAPPLNVRLGSIKRTFGDLEIFPATYISKNQPYQAFFLRKKVKAIGEKARRLTRRWKKFNSKKKRDSSKLLNSQLKQETLPAKGKKWKGLGQDQ